ncbi:DUF11 domain-containing protein [Chloroflexia bacterium SDU3-3]|nr:DUF11 domain-containing protein [Chloroflexia bacterium SDU3-3]
MRQLRHRITHGSSAAFGNRAQRRFSGWLRWVMVAFLWSLFIPQSVFALSSGDLTFTLVTPYLTQDSNNSCAAGPKAMYIEVLVTNPAGGTGAITNLTANLSAFAGAAGVVLDSGESSSRYIGTLADGASFPLYFYVNYPCQAGSNPPALTSAFTVTVNDGVTAALTSSTLTLTTRSEVSANAGGQVLNSVIGPGAVIGQIIPMTVNYDFGNPGGAQLAMIQPAGNVNFDSGCFRLMSTDITAVTGFTAGLTTAADDRLYFTGVSGASSNTATVVYYFKMLCQGASTIANPYSDLTSGGQLKYTGNFGFCSSANAVCPSYTPPANPFTITKTVSPTSLPTGGTATYTVVIANPSAYASKIDRITDVLPAGVSFGALSAGSQVTVANSSSTPSAGATGTINFVGVPTTSCVGGSCNGSYDIAANGTLTLVYTANVPNTAGSYTNSASSTIGSVSIGPSSATVAVGSADLSVAKSASASVVNVGSNVTFTIQVTNNGTGNTSGVAVTDLLPAGLTYVSSTPSKGTYTAGTGIWSVGALTNGEQATLTVVATVAQAGTLVNTATISASSLPDPNSANNTSSVTVTGQQADLVVTKTVSNANPNLNDQITYTVQVKNNGPSTATGVVISDPPPMGYSFISATPSGGTSYNSATGAWTVGTLANGASATLQIVMQVDVVTPVTNTASVSAVNQSDPNPANNTDSVTTPSALADLAVTKVANTATPNVGANVTFMVQVANNGPNAATGVQISDVLPSGLLFVSASGAGTYTSGTGVWNVGNLGAGATATLTLVATVTKAGALINTASVLALDQIDTNTANDQASATVTGQQADLAVAKTVSNATPNVGSSVTFTIQVVNNGPSNATGVAVTDLLPAGLSYSSHTASAGTTYTQASGVWQIGALSKSGVATLQIVATVTQPGSITNSASVSAADQPDPDSSNNTSSATLVGQRVDLAVAKTVSNATPNVGTNVTFTVQVVNNGPSAASGITLGDLLPGGLAFVSSTPSQGVYNNTTGLWSIGSLANGASATLAVVATVTQAGAITNVASIAAVAQPDSNAGNNTASVVVTGQQADLVITKSANRPTPNVGSNVTFTVQVVNNGPSSATGVVVSDLLPSGLSLVSATPSQGSYASGTGLWSLGTLANGASAALTMVATVTQPGSITNNASISAADQPDPVSSNNTTSATVAGQQADLALAKSVSDATPNAGDSVTFTVQVSNNGPSNATGVAVTDLLPAGLTFVSATPSQGSYAAGTGVWTVGGLANGASASLAIVATVTQAGVLVNTASVSAADQPDPVSANNTASAGLNGQQANLAVTKVVSSASPNVGSNVTFTVQVSNNGPSTATGVAVTDLLPAGLTFVSAAPSQGSYTAGTGLWSVGSLANGASATLTVVATVVQPVTIINSATITAANQPDPDSTDNTDSATVTGQQADLGLAKTVDTAAPNVGSNVTFTLQATNYGPSAATNITIQDVLPAGLTFVSAGAGYNSATGVWSIPSLANGATASLQIVATVTQVGTMVNSISVISADQPDANATNNTASVSITGQQADLALVKLADVSEQDVGSLVHFSIQLTNNGPSAASGVVVQDSLPVGLTYVSSVAGQGTYNSTTGAWTVGSLASGSSVVLTIVASVAQPGALTNSASILASDQPDPNAANNTASASVTGQQADLAVSKTVDNATPNVGSNVIYTIQVVNNGPSQATHVQLRDLLPAGLRLVSATAGQGTYTAGTGIWSVGDLANGASSTLTIVATVDQPGLIVNQVAITSADQPDPNGANNTASASLIGQQVDLAVSKTVDTVNPVAGNTIKYTILVRNNGPSNATGVQILDTLPGSVTWAGTNASQGTYSTGTGVWDVGSLANGATATLELTVTVNATTAILNTASVSAVDQPDPNSANNTSSVSTPQSLADLAVTKVASDLTPNVGDMLDFTIQVTNNGPNAASGIEVSDLLPAGMTFVSASTASGSYTAGSGLWVVGSLANGASASLIVTARADLAGSITNTAGVSKLAQIDPTLGDNSASATVVVQQADLAVQIAVDTATPNVGGQATYTITLTNNGPSDASGVSLLALLPAGLTLVSGSTAAGSYDSSSGIWTVGSLAVGASVTLTLVATVEQAGLITVTASVATADQPDPVLANNTASIGITGQQADLALSKSVNTAQPSVGSNVTFVLVLTNLGPSTATGVEVLDALPAGLSFVSAMASQGSYSSGTGLWSVGNVLSGGNATLQLVVTVTQAGTITNNTTVSYSDQPDPDASNNASSASVTGQVADLGITKAVDIAVPNTGDNVTFTIQVVNYGPSAASGVVVSDLLPAGLSFVSAAASQGSYDSGTGLWSIGALPSGSSATLFVVATVTQLGTITNNAAIQTSIPPDPNGANNTASAAVGGQQADIVVVKTVDVATPNVGSNVVFTIQVTNSGPSTATNVAVTDGLPAGLTFVSASASQGSYAAGSGIWSVGSIANAASATLTLVATVAQAGSITNSAAVSATDQPDPNSANNSSSATITGQQADVVLSKTVDVAAPNVGDQVVFTIQVSNNGPSTASGVEVLESLPSGLSFVSATASQGAYASGSGLWTVGSLGNGAGATLQVTATVAQIGTITNTASISGANTPDPDPSNNTSSATVGVQAADLQLVKTVNAPTPAAGNQVLYVITLANHGPSTATNVSVLDMLPAGLDFVSATASQGSYDSATGVWDVGTVGNGAQAELRITASITGSGVIVNVARVRAADQFDPNSTPGNNNGAENDQSAAPVSVAPTVVNLISFGASLTAAGVQISWTTVYERDVVGFHLLRSTDSTRAHAAQVTAVLIPGLGLQGGSYTWHDAAADSGVRYYYWLQEVDTDGRVFEYGPVSFVPGVSATRSSVFLPMVFR